MIRTFLDSIKVARPVEIKVGDELYRCPIKNTVTLKFSCEEKGEAVTKDDNYNNSSDDKSTSKITNADPFLMEDPDRGNTKGRISLAK